MVAVAAAAPAAAASVEGRMTLTAQLSERKTGEQRNVTIHVVFSSQPPDDFIKYPGFFFTVDGHPVDQFLAKPPIGNAWEIKLMPNRWMYPYSSIVRAEVPGFEQVSAVVQPGIIMAD